MPGKRSRCEFLREVVEIGWCGAREDRDVGNGALGERRDHRAVPDFHERRRRRARRASPLTFASARASSRGRPSVRASCRRPSSSATPRRLGWRRWSRRAGRSERRRVPTRCPSRPSHQRRVERAADVEARSCGAHRAPSPARRPGRDLPECRRSRPVPARCRLRSSRRRTQRCTLRPLVRWLHPGARPCVRGARRRRVVSAPRAGPRSERRPRGRASPRRPAP